MPEPVRLLRIVTRLNIGGPAVHAAILSLRLDAERFTTWLVTGQAEEAEGNLRDLFAEGKTPVLTIRWLRRSLHPWHDILAWLQLLRIVWRVRPEIIHTHMAKAGTLGRLAALAYNRLGPGRRRERRVKLVHTFHGHVLEGYFSPILSRLFLMVERWLAHRTHCLIAVSPAIREALLGKGIGRAEQWCVVPLGLDLSSLGEMPLPATSSTFRVGVIGRLVPVKNHHLFLQALHWLQRERGNRIRGFIVGDGSLRRSLEEEVSRLGLERMVSFAGWRRDLFSVYAQLDVACLTSWNEGTPVSLIEAMAAGRAVVATSVGGVRDLLADGRGAPEDIPPGRFYVAPRGILVRPGDVGGLAAALDALASDGTLRRRLAMEARPYALRSFAADRLLEDMTALYAAVRSGRD